MKDKLNDFVPLQKVDINMKIPVSVKEKEALWEDSDKHYCHQINTGGRCCGKTFVQLGET
ncbi:MAG: hypothetical protein JKY53_00085 [Flavobacteriales bacterium]|nr:hypothetical protein [Flavobacteriales bacterium]